MPLFPTPAIAFLALLAPTAQAGPWAVEPAPIVGITAERVQLPAASRENRHDGAKLAALQVLHPGAGTTVPGALDPASVVVRSGGTVLRENVDYRLDDSARLN